MKTNKRYKSDALAALHESMEGLHRSGVINKKTMREFDNSCLEDVPELKPEEIKALREREEVSQPIFALYMNVSKNLVSDWERGIKKPGGPALRLLSVIEKQGLDSIA